MRATMLQREIKGVQRGLLRAGRSLRKVALPLVRSWRPRRSVAVRAGSLGAVGTALAVGAGVVLLASRFGRETPPLERSLLATPRAFNFQGHRIAYYEQGQGDPVILVHGIYAAASAYEVREPFARLSARHRVLALDLLGFGASDRPPLRYRADLYVDLLVAFLREVVGRPAHLIASSLSAAYAACAAVREPARLRSLLLVNPTGVLTLARPQGRIGRALERLLRSKVLGQGLFNLLVSHPSLRSYLARTYRDASEVTPELVEHSYQTAHQPGARLAPAAFIGRALNVDLRAVLPQISTRSLVLWTEHNPFQDVAREREAFSRLAPQLPMMTLQRTGALPYDEDPAAFVALVEDFIAGPPGLSAPGLLRADALGDSALGITAGGAEK